MQCFPSCSILQQIESAEVVDVEGVVGVEDREGFGVDLMTGREKGDG